MSVRRVRVIDSHTEGEPTRVVVSGGPDLGGGPLTACRELFREHHDRFRSAVVQEPRGSDILVGALLLPARKTTAAAAVVFFNNAGPLFGCGHGTIGVARSLVHLGRIGRGRHVIETPAGDVVVSIEDEDPAGGPVEMENVPAFRHRKDVSLDVPGIGRVTGDVAWGGNWFFLVHGHDLEVVPAAIPRLTAAGLAVRSALAAGGVTGDGGAEIDHVEFSGPPGRDDCATRTYVLCPGGAYDRSPCGTGTSALVAGLAADGRLAPGEWTGVESILGTAFRARYRLADGKVIPTIAGSAWITADATLLFDDRDPLRDGIRA